MSDVAGWHSTPNGTDAWFGYDRVSAHQVLGDSQKEPVYATGCA